jgi:hypothetical protein
VISIIQLGFAGMARPRSALQLGMAGMARAAAADTQHIQVGPPGRPRRMPALVRQTDEEDLLLILNAAMQVMDLH